MNGCALIWFVWFSCIGWLSFSDWFDDSVGSVIGFRIVTWFGLNDESGSSMKYYEKWSTLSVGAGKQN